MAKAPLHNISHGGVQCRQVTKNAPAFLTNMYQCIYKEAAKENDGNSHWKGSLDIIQSCLPPEG